MTTRIPVLLAAALLAACSGAKTATPAAVDGGGGGSSGGSSGGGSGSGAVSGIAVPSEISAIPTSSQGAPASVAKASGLRAQAAAVAATDYDNVQTRRSVNERAVAQFDILNTIFGAMGQSHYADPVNVGAGPYKAMVSWVEEQGKQIIPWVVSSTMEKEGAVDVNVVKVWMTMPMKDGVPTLIRVTVWIYEAPSQNADGSYADYGVWKLHAKFAEDPAQGHFIAEAVRGAAGETVIQLSQVEPGGQGTTRGVLHKSAASGYGKVSFPDWDACNASGGCTGAPPPSLVTYVYDAATLSLRKERDGAAILAVKDRTSPVVVVNRYALFEKVSGDEAARHFNKTFGFPFRYAATGGGEGWGSYGAWQGRHQIWVSGDPLAEGTTVTRADVPNGQVAPSFTTTKRFVGTLTKRTLVAGSIDALANVVVNTWRNQQFQMQFDGTVWTLCFDPRWSGGPQPTCSSSQTLTEAQLGQVLPLPTETTRSAWLQACSPPPQGVQSPPPSCTQVAFKGAGSNGAGLYLASPSMNGPPQATDTPYVATAGAMVNGSLNGQYWIFWDGAAWWQKEVLSFNQNNCQATFGTQDTAFDFPLTGDVYLNRNGANYVVARNGSGYAVRVEQQTAANPANAATLVPAGTTFRRAWGDTSSSMSFDTDPASPTFLKLMNGSSVVTQGEFSLQATVGGVVQPEQYSWDYPSDPSQSWAAQQFLVDGSGALRLLDDPIQLRPISLADGSHVSSSYALAFDGNWVNGLPEIWSDLQASGYQMTRAIADKVVVIPNGQEVTDADGNAYLFKAIEMQEFLPLLPAATPADLSAAAALSLDAVPAFADGGLSATIPDAPLKYVEGAPVP